MTRGRKRAVERVTNSLNYIERYYLKLHSEKTLSALNGHYDTSLMTTSTYLTTFESRRNMS